MGAAEGEHDGTTVGIAIWDVNETQSADHSRCTHINTVHECDMQVRYMLADVHLNELYRFSMFGLNAVVVG